MESLEKILVFAGEAGVVVLAISFIIILIALIAARNSARSELEVESLDERWKAYARELKAYAWDRKAFKKDDKEAKSRKKSEKSTDKPRTFVLDFKGDIKASAADNLREEVTALLPVAAPGDEVVVRLESPGGVVHGYGLAAAQLLRLREAQLQLVICVDKVAASGGYLMACTGHKILASPFAIVGSVGVIAQVPNFHRLLKKHDVDYKEYTAGEFKRTVSLLGEITPKGEDKFKQQLEETHVLFKEFVKRYRPQLNVEMVATGEYWYGEIAMQHGLVDEIRTSDDYLMKAAQTRKVIHLRYHRKQPLNEKLSGMLGQAVQKGLTKTLEDLETRSLS